MFFFAEHDRRQILIADIDFYFDLSGTSYPAAYCHDVSSRLKLQMRNLEAFAGKSDRSKGLAGNSGGRVCLDRNRRWISGASAG